jgi:hypothetical protein
MNDRFNTRHQPRGVPAQSKTAEEVVPVSPVLAAVNFKLSQPPTKENSYEN